MIRTFEQDIVERFAANSRVPIINALTNEYHPCQILADIFTFIEHRGSIQGKTVAWIGDSNNMCNTWLQGGRGADFNVHDVSRRATRSSPSGLACSALTITSSSLPTRWKPPRAPTW